MSSANFNQGISGKGKKAMRGQGQYYNEAKKQLALSLTPTAIANLQKEADKHNLSKSEYIEQLARAMGEDSDRSD